MTLTRRDVLATVSATSVVGLVPMAQSATVTGLGTAADLRASAASFLASLPPNLREAASFPWDGRGWRGWSYFGVGGYIKPGVRLEQMTPAQRDAAWSIFAHVLSPAGMTKARNVMLLQDILAADGNGTGQRSKDRFSVAVFGTPAASGAWGLRLEGHHLSLSFAVRDDQVVSVTPAAFAAYPARVTRGPHAGLQTVQVEEMSARRLMSDLSPKLRSRTVVRVDELGNILSFAGRERSHMTPVGQSAADLTAAQRDLLREIVEAYAVTPYVTAMHDAQRKRLGDPAGWHFAWYGPNTPEKSFGYRIVAPTFVIELGCVDDAAQHIHPVYHDLATTLGRVA